MVRTGVITIEKLKEIRPYVIVGAFVIAAIFTPPDIISQFMLAVPLCLLYELGIFIAAFIAKKHQKETSDSSAQLQKDSLEQKDTSTKID